MTAPIVVCGAGLAGLSCARTLSRQGVPVLVLESRPYVGGRVATVSDRGFLLDVGFQVLLTGYPEARAQLDLPALGLRSFRAGSRIRLPDRSTVIADPWREPIQGLRSLFSPAMTVSDAWHMARLRWRSMAGRDTANGNAGGGTASDVLDRAKISDTLRSSFLEPFFSGVTLDPSLSIPADYFSFLFRMFARGSAALPARGMQAIPKQLAAAIPADAIRTGCGVRAVAGDHVVTEHGETIQAAAVVVATDANSAQRLLGRDLDPAWHSTTTVYFATDEPPFSDAMLMLNGTGSGPACHLSVPSLVQPTYAPDGQALISVSVLDDAHHPEDHEAEARLVEAVRDQMHGWFGKTAGRWRWLRSFPIRYAQPVLPAGQAAMTRTGIDVVEPNLIVCGDHLATPSIHGAMLAGRHAAERLLAGCVTAPSAELPLA